MSKIRKHPENEARGTRLSGAVLGATVLTAALIGASALVIVVTNSPSTSKTAAITTAAPHPTHTPGSSLEATGSLAPAPQSKSVAPVATGPAPSSGKGGKPSSSPGSSSSAVAAPAGKPLNPSSPSKTSQWAAAKSGSVMQQVTDDSGLVLQDYSVRDYVSTRQECSVLTAAVKSAQAQAPIPDSAMQKRYASALTAFASGAQLCSSAITQHSEGPENVTTTVNHSAMTQALSQLSTGTKDLYVATEKLRKQ